MNDNEQINGNEKFNDNEEEQEDIFKSLFFNCYSQDKNQPEYDKFNELINSTGNKNEKKNLKKYVEDSVLKSEILNLIGQENKCLPLSHIIDTKMGNLSIMTKKQVGVRLDKKKDKINRLAKIRNYFKGILLLFYIAVLISAIKEYINPTIYGSGNIKTECKINNKDVKCPTINISSEYDNVDDELGNFIKDRKIINAALIGLCLMNIIAIFVTIITQRDNNLENIFKIREGTKMDKGIQVFRILWLMPSLGCFMLGLKYVLTHESKTKENKNKYRSKSGYEMEILLMSCSLVSISTPFLGPLTNENKQKILLD